MNVLTATANHLLHTKCSNVNTLLRLPIILLYLMLSGTAFAQSSTPGTITTIAGTGLVGFSGDGGEATNAKLNTPSDVAVDIYGNIFVCDRFNNRIRKINTSGIISTVASGFGPLTIVADKSGNIYFSEQNPSTVSKINSSGIVTRIAGTGTSGYSGDGGPAINAQLHNPLDMEIDSKGSIYICDQGNGCIRKINTLGIITTIAGNGKQGFDGDGGPARSATMNPSGIVIDALGNIYVAEAPNQRIRKIDRSGIITTIAGTGVQGYSGDGGQAINASFNYPECVAMDASGNFFISEENNHVIRKINPSGIITTVAGTGVPGFSGDGGPAINARLSYPGFLDIDSQGNIYFADDFNHRIRKIAFGGVGDVKVDAGEDKVLYFGYGIPCIKLFARVTNGTPPYKYLWSPPGATSPGITVCPSKTTTYSVSVTDGNNMKVSDQVKITVVDVRCGNKNDRIRVCHNGKTLCLSRNAVEFHLKHGDRLGNCTSDPANCDEPTGSLKVSFHPNPFRYSTRVEYYLPVDGKVALKLFDNLGRERAIIANAKLKAGSYSTYFNGSKLPEGIYYYQLKVITQNGKLFLKSGRVAIVR